MAEAPAIGRCGPPGYRQCTSEQFARVVKHRKNQQPFRTWQSEPWGSFRYHSAGAHRPLLDHTSARCLIANSHSQWGEDRVLLLLLLGLPTSHHTFVEIGAFNGIDYSNTIALERCFRWRGLLVEANPGSWERLQRNRCGDKASKNACVHSGVCRPAGNMSVTPWEQEISGSMDDMSEAHLNRWGRWNRVLDQRSHVTVPCAPLSSLVHDAALPHVGFLSIDVEGAEYRVLQSTNLAAVDIVMVEADGLNPLKDAYVQRELLLNGFSPLPLHARGSQLYHARDLQLRMGCEMSASRSARGEDMMLLPSLLAIPLSARGAGVERNGTFVEEAQNPLTSIVEACFDWRPATAQDSRVDLLSVYAPRLESVSQQRPLHRYSMIAVQGSESELHEAGRLLTNGSTLFRPSEPFVLYRRLAMADTAVYCRPGLLRRRELADIK